MDGYSPYCDALHIEQLEHLPVCESVKRLILSEFTDGAELHDDEFKAILSKFPNIGHLRLYNVANVKLDVVKPLLPNLTELAICPSSSSEKVRYAQLMHQYIGQLQELEVVELDLTGLKIVNMQCDNLTVLKLHRCTPFTMQYLTESAKNLKQIDISKLDSVSQNTVEEALCDSLTNCPSLDYIEFYDSRQEHVMSAIDGIDNGLYRTWYINRNAMKICIGMRTCDPINLISNVKSLVTRLKSSTIEDYMFVWKMEAERAKLQICESLEMNAFIIKGSHMSSIVIRKEGSYLY